MCDCVIGKDGVMFFVHVCPCVLCTVYDVALCGNTIRKKCVSWSLTGWLPLVCVIDTKNYF